MKFDSRIAKVAIVVLCSEIYVSASFAEVPVLREAPTRAFNILGQLKQGECKKNASDTQAMLEQRVISLFGRLAEAGFKDAKAVINFSCAQRKKLLSYNAELQKAVQCDEGIHCEGDVISWQ